MTDTTEMTLQEKIEYYEKQFKSKKRGEEDIVVFNNECDELHDSVYSAHGDKMPNDWIFGTYADLLTRLTEYTINTSDDLEEFRNEIVDGAVDIYTSDLLDWLKGNTEYTDEVLEENNGITSTSALLMQAQYKAIDAIYSEIYTLLVA